MPNWCENEVTITGPALELARLYSEVCTSEEEDGLQFDFNRVVPMPNNIFRGNLGQEERERHGEMNWYDWSIANWGTKWNASEPSVSRKERSIQIDFDTAWSPPEPVIAKLSSMYPELTIIHSYYEGGMGFNGKDKWKAGIKVDAKFNDKYRGNRGG